MYIDSVFCKTHQLTQKTVLTLYLFQFQKSVSAKFCQPLKLLQFAITVNEAEFLLHSVGMKKELQDIIDDVLSECLDQKIEPDLIYPFLQSEKQFQQDEVDLIQCENTRTKKLLVIAVNFIHCSFWN